MKITITCEVKVNGPLSEDHGIEASLEKHMMDGTWRIGTQNDVWEAQIVGARAQVWPGSEEKHNIHGQRFGFLTAIERAEPRNNKNGYWLCLCDCGKQCVVHRKKLINGRTKSCGCYRKARYGTNRRPQDRTEQRLYDVWQSMRQRCYNPNNKRYHNYGGRSIIMCPAWKDSFQVFRDDVFATYQRGLSIDRIDNDGPYCPFNVRWATPIQQANNSRTAIRLTWNGETHTLRDWAEKLGVPVETIRRRYEANCPRDQILSV